MLPTMLSSAQDYVARARYFVGTGTRDDVEGGGVSAVETRRIIAKLERATTELRQGILSLSCFIFLSFAHHEIFHARGRGYRTKNSSGSSAEDV
jgi:hypothetical protein